MRQILLLLIIGLPLLSLSQNVAIQHKKMNVFYIGVDNPIKIVVENYQCNELVAKAKYGNLVLTSDSCNYIYKIDTCSQIRDSIIVGVKKSNQIQWIDTLDFRLKRIPDPIPKIAHKKGGLIDKHVLINTSRLTTSFENLDINASFNVESYSVKIIRRRKMIYDKEDIKGYMLSDELKTEFKNLKSGDKIIFYNIQVEPFYNICWNRLADIIFKVE